MTAFEKHVRSLTDEMLEKLVAEYERLAKAEEFYNLDFGTAFHEKFDTVMEESIARAELGSYLTYAE